MFDFGFSELMICGVVGLVVLGPERLPVVAKTAGEWIGKAQRFVQQMKDDINRETELSELKKIKDDAQKIASDLNSTVQNAAKSIESDVNAVAGEAEKTVSEARESFEGSSGTGSGEAASESGGSDDGYNPFASSADDSAYASYDSSDFSWSDSDSSSQTKIFEKRYVSGPSVDELAAEVARLQEKLDMARHQFTGNNRRYAARARTSRPRIYR